MSSGKRFALAAIVLLVGVGGAFLFPRDEEQRGADTAQAATTQEARPESPRNAPAAPPARQAPRSAQRSESLSVPPLRGLGIPVPSPSFSHDMLAGDTGVTPAPSTAGVVGAPLAAATQRSPPSLPPEFSAQWEAGSQLRTIYRSQIGQPLDDSEQPSPFAERIHRVRDDDTLRSLAEQYLQDPQRYLEIYQLNRDLLKDGPTTPLPIKANLRIPALVARPAPPAVRVDTPVVQRQPDTPRSRLVPVKPISE